MMKIPTMTPCESSRITEHAHDPATNTLYLRFKAKEGRGSLYSYTGFPAERYAELCCAESVGRFFGQVVSAKDEDGKFVYPYSRIEDAPAEDA